MKIQVSPSIISGTISAIPSKSDAHRLIIASLLSEAPTEIALKSSSDDIDATLSCVKELGADITRTPDSVMVSVSGSVSSPTLDCSESGSTLRFILPVASALCDEVSFTGHGRLPDRPIKELLDAMRKNGAEFNSDRLPITKRGRLHSGVYELPGNVSSQYITGLLFALPLLDGDSQIKLTTSLESSPYIDITLSALEKFGIEIKRDSTSFYIKGAQKYISPSRLSVDGDWSNASYFLAMGLLSKPVTVSGLDLSSPQGDKKIIDVLKRMGAYVDEETVTAHPSELISTEIDVCEIPDMFPTLAVMATRARGTTRFTGIERLRIKESDRVLTVASLITALGGKVRDFGAILEVDCSDLYGGEVDSVGDHRIVMAAALASTFCKSDVIINGAEAVNKSYPSFFEDFKKLGGKYNVI